MLVTLPYELPPLVTTAPLDIHRSTVLPEWGRLERPHERRLLRHGL